MSSEQTGRLPALAAEDVGRLVQELAGALRRPAEPEDFAPLLRGQFDDPTAELPQILKRRPDNRDLPRLSTWRVDPSLRTSWRTKLFERLRSGAPRIVTALGAVAMLAMASIGAINSFASLSAVPDSHVAAISNDFTAATTASEMSVLLDRGKRMIDRGNIAAARSLLEPAARAGDPAALMALAETFDPNMLAAWGARGLSADTHTARELYARAHMAGVPEAGQRLEALKEAP
ncbi:MAG TPA: hypothetical protein VNK52_11090 [Hyphomicrobiaceae bacterium]|nr:hypothetical protein [Hyphomicrobiaceae bacterium]